MLCQCVCVEAFFTSTFFRPHFSTRSQSHSIHVWYIYLHLPEKSTSHVGKYTTIHGWYGNDSTKKSSPVSMYCTSHFSGEHRAQHATNLE